VASGANAAAIALEGSSAMQTNQPSLPANFAEACQPWLER
jgi:hypothetical protein